MTKVPNVKRVLWNFLEPSHSARFFSFSFPEGEIFQDSAVCHWSLHWKEAELILLKAANHKFLGVTQCLIWCEVIPKTKVIFTIMLSSFPVIFIKFQFFLSRRKHNLKVVFCLFGGRSKKKSYLSRVFEAKRKHRASLGRQLYQYQWPITFSKFTQKIKA